MRNKFSKTLTGTGTRSIKNREREKVKDQEVDNLRNYDKFDDGVKDRERTGIRTRTVQGK